MAKTRTITKLELIQASAGGKPGCVVARWERADGSTGEVAAWFRPRAAERWYIAILQITNPTTALLRDVPLARIERAANADPKIRQWIKAGAPPETRKLMKRTAAKRLKLTRPAGPLDDRFYQAVAAAYAGALAHGLQPSKTLADESDTPQGTVNRWIAEARRRGHLAPARPGKASV